MSITPSNPIFENASAIRSPIVLSLFEDTVAIHVPFQYSHVQELTLILVVQQPAQRKHLFFFTEIELAPSFIFEAPPL